MPTTDLAPTLRRAGPDDAPALAVFAARVFVETFVDGFAIAYPPEDLERFLAETCSVARLSDLMRSPRTRVWIAQSGRAIVAYAVAGPASLPHPDVRPQDGELYRLYVDRPWQARGLGGRLLEGALRWLESRGHRRLFIGVWSGNTRAARLYAAHGFTKVGEYEFPVGATMDREFIVRRG